MTPDKFDALPRRVKEEMIATYMIENMIEAISNYWEDPNKKPDLL